MFVYITNSDLYTSLMKLNEICEVYSGYAIKEFNNIKNGLPVIKIGNIHSDGRLNLGECQFSMEDINEKYHSKKGDIYIALSGATTGKLGIMEDEKKFIINQRVGVIRLKQKSISQSYIKYYLLKQTERIIDEATGCAQPNISPKQIGEYDIPVFSEKEMLQISNVLNNIECIIKYYKAMLEKYDDLIKARFVEMFGDPIRNTQNRPTTELINVVKMQRGFDLPVQDRQQDGNIPVFGSNGALDHHNVAKVKGGGVITGRSGTIGNVYYTDGDYWPLNTSLFSIDTHGNNVVYLAYLLTMYDLSRFTEGTGVPTLNRNKFHNKPIIDVSLDEQIQFADFVKQVDKSKFIQMNSTI